VQATAPLGVQPRGWQWPGSGDLSYAGGGLTWPQNEQAFGKTCRGDLGCGAWVVQPDSIGFTQGSGYLASEIDDGGPNDGAWYVQSVTADVALASAIRPDLLENGQKRPQGCPPADSLNFIDFNESSCAENDPGWGEDWLDWAWDHEDLHAIKAFDFVGENSEFDIPHELEPLVRTTKQKLQEEVEAIVGPSKRCVHMAAALHSDSLVSPPHQPPTFDLWIWNGQNYAERQASEGAWWDDEDDFEAWLEDWGDCY
jgi:hypothetical protein